jgi:glucosylceramidase
MRSRYFAPYAQYFLKFLQGYAAAGVPVQAVTVQNEVDTDQDARMPACLWPQEYEIAFVKDHLGPLLEKSNVATKIWMLDHNYNLWGRAVDELEDSDLRKYCNAIAFHGYVGTADMMSKVHDSFPDVHLYWTEGGPDYTAPDYATDWANWGRTFTQVLRNWCQSVTGWNLALDEKGRPNIGPFSCGGMVSIHSETKQITRSGQYWAFAHFSRHVQRGARRFQSSGNLSGVDHVAFENPNGGKVLVLTNAGDPKTISVQLANRVVKVSLSRNCLKTLLWT